MRQGVWVLLLSTDQSLDEGRLQSGGGGSFGGGRPLWLKAIPRGRNVECLYQVVLGGWEDDLSPGGDLGDTPQQPR